MCWSSTSPSTNWVQIRDRPMSPRNHGGMGHGREVVAVILVGLLLLAAILWFADPTQHYDGQSRIGWPPAATKP